MRDGKAARSRLQSGDAPGDAGGDDEDDEFGGGGSEEDWVSHGCREPGRRGAARGECRGPLACRARRRVTSQWRT